MSKKSEFKIHSDVDHLMKQMAVDDLVVKLESMLDLKESPNFSLSSNAALF